MTINLKSKILWLNKYLPGDPGLENFDQTELRATLTGVKWGIENSDYDSILWCGDINADFSRNNHFRSIVGTFINKHQLKKTWDVFSIDHTFICPTYTSTSTIDHFKVITNLINCVKTAGVIHRGDNLSGHSPIVLKLQTSEILRIDSPPCHYFPKQCWKKANVNDINGFKTCMKNKLDLIKQPSSIFECTNLNCQSLEHQKDIDQYITDIINCIEQSSQDCIPYATQINQKEK